MYRRGNILASIISIGVASLETFSNTRHPVRAQGLVRPKFID